MFGLFKKQPEFIPQNDHISLDDCEILDAGLFDQPDVYSHNEKGELTIYGFTMAELDQHEENHNREIRVKHPRLAAFLDKYPTYNTTSLSFLSYEYEKAIPVATEEVRRDLLVRNQTVTEEELQLLIKLRAEDIVIENNEVEAIASRRYNMHIAAFEREDRILDKLDDIRESVDRGAVAANTIDAIAAHPFLAGFVGSYLFGKIKQR